MSLIEDARAPDRREGVHILIDYADAGWPKSQIEYFANRGTWEGFSENERKSLAEELMTKYWGHIAAHKLRAE